ncbi:MAG TPA: hypothetical protein DCY59_03405 [Micrococcaceae bacterium]|nr:hypothetical protein [Micrococcaceae bacterium]
MLIPILGDRWGIDPKFFVDIVKIIGNGFPSPSMGKNVCRRGVEKSRKQLLMVRNNLLHAAYSRFQFKGPVGFAEPIDGLAEPVLAISGSILDFKTFSFAVALPCAAGMPFFTDRHGLLLRAERAGDSQLSVGVPRRIWGHLGEYVDNQVGLCRN